MSPARAGLVMSLCLAVGSFIFSPGSLLGAEPVILEAGRGTFRLGTFLEILRDETNQLTVEDVLAAGGSRFYSYGWDRTPNFGYSSATYWVRFRVYNPLTLHKEMLLELANPLLDDARVFFVNEGEAAARPSIIESKSIKHRVYLFPLSVRPQSGIDVYLQVRSKGSIALPLTLFRPDAFAREDQNTQFALGLYYGLIIVMILYNLSLYVALRERTYLYYSLALFCIHGLLQFAVNGLARKYLPMSGWWNLGSIPFFGSIGMFWALLFCRQFLNTAMRTPEIHRITSVLMLAALVMAVMSFFTPYRVTITVLILLGLVGVSTVIAAGAYTLQEGFRPARYYLTAWSVVLVGALIFNMKAWGWLPSTPFTEYSAQGGLAIEAILLALALSDRFNTIRQEKFTAQQRVLEQERMTREAEEELIFHLRQMEDLKKDFLAMAIEEPGRTLDSLIDKILATLHRILQFDKGFITVIDRFDRYVSSSVGEIPPYVAEFVPRAFQVIKRFNPPEDFFAELNAITNLRDITRLPFAEESAVLSAYHENARTIRTFLGRLSQDEFHLLIPLSFRNELFGYMVTGKTMKEQLTESNLNLLEAFRLSAALSIRNAMLYDELSLLKGKAEDSVQQLSEYIVGIHNAREHRLGSKSLIYLSKSMTEIVDQARKLAGKKQPMLVTGETGTGKDMVANLIHETSSPPGSPFVAVNCAAIPANLWESEIFGHIKGSFTDAKTDRPGRIEQATGGTIFFDEIGEMPLDMQPKLLRLIQEKKYQRVGGTKELKADCSFIFATNRDLEAMQAKGLFRQDLYYRINVFQLRVPPLRERRADIPALVNYFLEKYCVEMGYPTRRCDDRAIDALCHFNWPGNVRELENAVIQAIVNSRTEIIRRDDLPVHVLDFRKSRPGEETTPIRTLNAKPEAWDGRPLEDILNEQARQIILAALAKTNGNKVEAAKSLGLKRATFYNRLKELGI